MLWGGRWRSRRRSCWYRAVIPCPLHDTPHSSLGKLKTLAVGNGRPFLMTGDPFDKDGN